jgi:hypothetical protein
VTSELDIYRSAQAIIKQHGEGAEVHAAMRADALLEAGDLECQRVWLRIIAAIEELLRDRVAEGEAGH